MDVTARLSLPFLSPGQAQKEIVHNESLRILDMLVAASVEEASADPPDDPAAGSCYIVDKGATGEWIDRDGSLACYTATGWEFIDAPEGTSVFVRSLGLFAIRRNEDWETGVARCSSVIVAGKKILGAQCDPIASPAGGKTVDKEARAVLDDVLGTLRAHGLIQT